MGTVNCLCLFARVYTCKHTDCHSLSTWYSSAQDYMGNVRNDEWLAQENSQSRFIFSQIFISTERHSRPFGRARRTTVICSESESLLLSFLTCLSIIKRQSRRYYEGWHGGTEIFTTARIERALPISSIHSPVYLFIYLFFSPQSPSHTQGTSGRASTHMHTHTRDRVLIYESWQPIQNCEVANTLPHSRSIDTSLRVLCLRWTWGLLPFLFPPNR